MVSNGFQTGISFSRGPLLGAMLVLAGCVLFFNRIPKLQEFPDLNNKLPISWRYGRYGSIGWTWIMCMACILDSSKHVVLQWFAYCNQTASHNNIRNCINQWVTTSWSEVSQDCTSLAICWYGWQDYDLGLPQSAEVRVSKRIKRAVTNERWEKEKREDNLKGCLICWSNMYQRIVRMVVCNFREPLVGRDCHYKTWLD